MLYLALKRGLLIEKIAVLGRVGNARRFQLRAYQPVLRRARLNRLTPGIVRITPQARDLHLGTRDPPLAQRP